MTEPTTPRISSCYDHFSGLAGQRLARRLVELGWVVTEPHPGITPLGWTGFANLGLSLAPLMGAGRKPVAFCTEGRDGSVHETHLGGHLGALIRRHFMERGWLATGQGQLELTPAGEQVLQQLGVNLEAQS